MEDAADGPVVVLGTAPDAEMAARIARALVHEGLAACVNLLPGVTSVYRWQGAVHEDPEALMVMKTRRGRVPELLARLAQLHPYEVPEALALPVEAGLPAYCRWVMDETGAAPELPDAAPTRATETPHAP